MLDRANGSRRTDLRVEELELDDGHVVRYRRHANGGGRVALDATVHATAHVAVTSWADPGAVVEAGVLIGRHCWVQSHASIGAFSVLAECVDVGLGATIGTGCRVGSHAAMGPGSEVEDGAVVEPDAYVGRGPRARR